MMQVDQTMIMKIAQPLFTILMLKLVLKLDFISIM